MRKRDERGAVAVLVAIVLVAVLLPVAAMGVDLGMQRVVRRDLQALADAVALDLARELDGRPRSALAPAIDLGDPASVLSTSVRRNSGSVLGATPAVAATWGAWNGAVFDAAADPPTAVRVVADGEVDFGFAPGSGSARRTAYASSESTACFQLGSFAASVDPAASVVLKRLLQPLLGNTTLTAAGYDGLATATVSLAELIAAPSIGVGSVREVLDSGDITVGEFYLAAANALTGQGKLAQAQVFSRAAVSAVAPVALTLSDLFAISTASADAVLDMRFNAMDLLLGAAFLANGENLVGLHNLQAGIPSVGVTNVDLDIIERPQRACGSMEALTAQLRLAAVAKMTLNAAPLQLGLPLVELRMKDADGRPTNDASLGLDVELAGARGRLTSVSCQPDVFEAAITSDLVRARLTGALQLGGSVKVDVLGLTGVKVPVTLGVALTADASKPASTTPEVVQLAIPPATYGDHVNVDSNDVVLPRLTASIVPGSIVAGPVTVNVLGIPVTVPTQDLVALVTPVLEGILNPLAGVVGAVADPLIAAINADLRALTTALGLSVAGADFFPLPWPSCNEPRLTG